ncbi:MAG TPA: helix-turn-helix domain-containing protein [Solirubrobacterales bacterium]|nr:helix-turn-helix domain-containing protein [Solirubrobacterales bacterium]
MAAVLAHVETICDREPGGVAHPAALRRAVAENVEVGLHQLEHGIRSEDRMVEVALRQARQAARNGISADTVLRRYTAGERLLADFIVQEGHDLPGDSLHRILSQQREQVNRVCKAIAAAHSRERETLDHSPPARLEQQVVRLLAGDPSVDVGSIDYPFDGWHVAMLLVGKGGEECARSIGAGIGKRVLAVPRPEAVTWAWIGGRERPPLPALEATVLQHGSGVSIGIGEPRRALEGWRHSHEEARAAFQVMRHRPQPLTKAREVLLLAAVLRDETLAQSLRDTYMAPLDEFGSSAAALRETLRTYLELGGNAVTAAAALGVDRHTVHRRLRKVEEAIGAPLHGCHGELEVALELERLAANANG